MSETILANVNGFTPLIDSVTLDCGIIASAVFGKIWRYCQMSDGMCRAGQERIADELGLTRATVNSYIAKLIDSGYIVDKTPAIVGSPHSYADTGKAGVSNSFTGKTKPVKEFDTPCQNILQVGVKEFDTKIVLRDSLRKDEDITKSIITALQSNGIYSTVGIREHLDDWTQEHEPQWIIKAIEKGRGKNLNYIDRILVDWKSNGYPKSRQEQMDAAKRAPRQPAANERVPSGV